MSKIRRICIHAGPGSGKSTISAQIFSELKIRGHNVEHISEYVKTWAHEGKKPISFDQAYVYAKQLHAEDVILRNVPLIVAESPLLMNNAYAAFYGCDFVEPMVQLSQMFDQKFPAINFFLDRSVLYQQVGRYQDYNQALEFDKYLLNFLAPRLAGELIHVKVDDFAMIMDIIENKLKESADVS